MDSFFIISSSSSSSIIFCYWLLVRRESSQRLMLNMVIPLTENEAVQQLATGWTTEELKFEPRYGRFSFSLRSRDRFQVSLSLPIKGYRGLIPRE
jgi:hypothetical protein